MIWGNKMIELGVAALLGAIIGGRATFGVIESSKQPAPIVGSDQVAKSQVDVQKQLTDLDIIDPICSSDYIEKIQIYFVEN